MKKLCFVRRGRFDRVTQSLGNLRAPIKEQYNELVLVEDSCLESPINQGEGRPERPPSSRRPDAQPFPSAEHLGALAHTAAELNFTHQRVRQMERARTAWSPGAPPIGLRFTVPPNAYDAQGLEPTGADTSRLAHGERPKVDAAFKPEIEFGRMSPETCGR